MVYRTGRRGRKFILIIDEWDVLIRDEADNQKIQEDYIRFLRALFKGTEPTKYIRLAYLTGILPIKKVKTQLALNNFDEYTMLFAGALAPYVGFTEDEEKCEKTVSMFPCHQVVKPGGIFRVSDQNKIECMFEKGGIYSIIIAEKIRGYENKTGGKHDIHLHIQIKTGRNFTGRR